jgi:hypothetical protein
MTNDYSKKSWEELHYIVRDAFEAAQCMKGFDAVAEAKYLDQINDAETELYKRKLKQEAFYAARAARRASKNLCKNGPPNFDVDYHHI